MWEVLHLYSRYNKENFVKATSSEEEFVSAYPTVNAAGDSITVVLVNRSVNATKSVKVNLNGFDLANESFQTLRLSNLPSLETFISHTNNALQKATVAEPAHADSLSLPPPSIPAPLPQRPNGEAVTSIEERTMNEKIFKAHPNPAASVSVPTIEINKQGNARLDLIDLSGRVVKNFYDQAITSPSFKEEEDLSSLSKGIYIFRLNLDGQIIHRKVSLF
jgi:hypothetical protein